VRLALAVLASVALACLSVAPASADAAAKKTVWLCKPGLKKNPCETSLTATIVGADGKARKVERSRIARRAPIDCFYVYPTVSGQNAITATLAIEPEQRAIASWQASRFSQHCRVFAPVYRQLTLLGILDLSKATPAEIARPYKDVRAAWREYLRKYNKGRGVVLIGHSQGTFVLRQLIRKEIDKRPRVRRKLVSALLTGGNVTVRKGRDAGGDFRNVRACRSPTQIGCVVAFSVFGETPPAGAVFGRVAGDDAKRLEVLCTNPAALRGGRGKLRPYVRSDTFPGTFGLLIRAFAGELPAVTTPWIAEPAAYSARCSSAGGADVLRVTPAAGAPVLTPVPDATWGLHLGDVNLPLGNLTALVRRQSAAYAKHSRAVR
jgi:hypothetical protein